MQLAQLKQYQCASLREHPSPSLKCVIFLWPWILHPTSLFQYCQKESCQKSPLCHGFLRRNLIGFLLMNKYHHIFWFSLHIVTSSISPFWISPTFRCLALERDHFPFLNPINHSSISENKKIGLFPGPLLTGMPYFLWYLLAVWGDTSPKYFPSSFHPFPHFRIMAILANFLIVLGASFFRAFNLPLLPMQAEMVYQV